MLKQLRYYSLDGMVYEEGHYRKGKLHGLFKRYVLIDSKMRLVSILNYRDGKVHGAQYTYNFENINGILKKHYISKEIFNSITKSSQKWALCSDNKYKVINKSTTLISSNLLIGDIITKIENINSCAYIKTRRLTNEEAERLGLRIDYTGIVTESKIYDSANRLIYDYSISAYNNIEHPVTYQNGHNPRDIAFAYFNSKVDLDIYANDRKKEVTVTIDSSNNSTIKFSEDTPVLMRLFFCLPSDRVGEAYDIPSDTYCAVQLLDRYKRLVSKNIAAFKWLANDYKRINGETKLIRTNVSKPIRMNMEDNLIRTYDDLYVESSTRVLDPFLINPEYYKELYEATIAITKNVDIYSAMPIGGSGSKGNIIIPKEFNIIDIKRLM